MTTINEHGLFIDMPGEWERVESEEPGSLVYREVDGDALLTIMLLRVRPLFSIADRQRLLSDYVQHRRKYERGRTPGLELAEPTFGDRDDPVEARWSALTPSGRQQRHRVIIADDVLGHFGYEATASDESFDERVAALLDGATVSPSAASDS